MIYKHYPSTCHCVLESDDGINLKLVKKCKSHNTIQEVLSHNSRFAKSTTTEQQTRDEKNKPEFQRR